MVEPLIRLRSSGMIISMASPLLTARTRSDDGGSQLMRFGYVLVSIVVARFDVTLDALLAFLEMLGITLLRVDATRRCHLFDARTSADANTDAARRARCRRRRRCRRLVVLFVSQTAQEALVNWLWRGLWLLAARWTGRWDYHLREQNKPTVKMRRLVMLDIVRNWNSRNLLK